MKVIDIKLNPRNWKKLADGYALKQLQFAIQNAELAGGDRWFKDFADRHKMQVMAFPEQRQFIFTPGTTLN